MKNKIKTNCERESPLSHRKPTLKQTAETLLEDYENKLRAGENPDPKDYLDRYPGPKDDFIMHVHLVTLLQAGAMEIGREWSRLVGPEEIRKIEAKIYGLLFKDNTRDQPKK